MENILRGVLLHAFPAPGKRFVTPDSDVVEVRSEANVPGAIVLTLIPSLMVSVTHVAGHTGITGLLALLRGVIL